MWVDGACPRGNNSTSPSPLPRLVLPWLYVSELPSSSHADVRYEAPASTTYPTLLWPMFAPELRLSPLPLEAHTVNDTPVDYSSATAGSTGFQFCPFSHAFYGMAQNIWKAQRSKTESKIINHSFPPARQSWAHQRPLHGGVPFMDFPGGA